jgi:hypothetical protein
MLTMRPLTPWLAGLVLTVGPLCPADCWGAHSPGPDPAPTPALHSLRVPASAEDVARAAGLPPPASEETLLLDLIRVLHERPVAAAAVSGGPLGSVRSLLRAANAAVQATAPETPPLLVPLPLDPEAWRTIVFGRQIPLGDLFAAILEDRRASLLYAGLVSVDAPTLDALAVDRRLLARLFDRHAAALAAFGRSLAIRGGIVELPGPPGTGPAWEALIGERASEVGRFVPALLGRDDGRVAYYYDAIAQLDEPHRRFAAGGPASGPDAAATLRRLFRVFRRVSPEWNAAAYPYYRPPVDPAVVLRVIRVTPDGRLAPPSSQWLWAQVFGSAASRARGGRPAGTGQSAGAVWLLERVLADGPRTAAVRLDQVRFAQRVFASAAPVDSPALVEAVAAYARFPALMLALERLGFTDPDLHARAARHASSLTARVRRVAEEAPLALFQGSIALVDRAHSAGTLDRGRAQRLVADLIDVDPAAADYAARLLDWWSAHLVPSLAEATGTTPAARPEATVMAALAGVSALPAGRPPRVEWEGRGYLVDVPAASLRRLQAVRAAQGPPSLDQALALHAAVGSLDTSPGGPALARIDAILAALAAAFREDDATATVRAAVDRAREDVATARAGGGRVRDARHLDIVVGLAAADVLRALVYVPALGDPRGPARLGGHLARRHAFAWAAATDGGGSEPAWREPEEHVTADRGWHVRGALLGLEVALARLSLRRIDVDAIPAGPRLDEVTRQRFVVDAALARPSEVSDTERDLLAAALTAGRARVRDLVDEPAGLAEVASRLSLDNRRVNALRWALAHGLGDPATRFALTELAALGAPPERPLPFALASVPDHACPRTVPSCPRTLTDLSLRLLEGLAELRLPAALLAGMLGPATQDFVDLAQPMHRDDHAALWAYAGTLPRARIEDYVAMLAGEGALVPETSGPPTGGRR